MSDAAKIQRREHSEGRRITVCVFAQNLAGCAFFTLFSCQTQLFA